MKTIVTNVTILNVALNRSFFNQIPTHISQQANAEIKALSKSAISNIRNKIWFVREF